MFIKARFFRSAPLRPISTSLRRVLAIAVVALAVVWVAAIFWISQMRDFARDHAALEITGLVNVLSDHTDRMLQSVDLLLVLLTSRLEPLLPRDADGSDGALHAVLSRDAASLPQIRRAAVTLSRGIGLSIAVPVGISHHRVE